MDIICVSSPNLKCNPNTNDMQQYNAVVTRFKSNKFCVYPNSLLDFEVFVKHLCNLLWEIDSHYEKFKARKSAFPNVVERNFLKLNKSQSHGHNQSSRHEMSLRCLKQISIERDISKTSQKHLKRDVFFETSLRLLKYISRKMSFLRRL